MSSLSFIGKFIPVKSYRVVRDESRRLSLVEPCEPHVEELSGLLNLFAMVFPQVHEVFSLSEDRMPIVLKLRKGDVLVYFPTSDRMFRVRSLPDGRNVTCQFRTVRDQSLPMFEVYPRCREEMGYVFLSEEAYRDLLQLMTMLARNVIPPESDMFGAYYLLYNLPKNIYTYSYDRLGSGLLIEFANFSLYRNRSIPFDFMMMKKDVAVPTRFSVNRMVIPLTSELVPNVIVEQNLRKWMRAVPHILELFGEEPKLRELSREEIAGLLRPEVSTRVVSRMLSTISSMSCIGNAPTVIIVPVPREEWHYILPEELVHLLASSLVRSRPRVPDQLSEQMIGRGFEYFKHEVGSWRTEIFYRPISNGSPYTYLITGMLTSVPSQTILNMCKPSLMILPENLPLNSILGDLFVLI